MWLRVGRGCTATTGEQDLPTFVTHPPPTRGHGLCRGQWMGKDSKRPVLVRVFSKASPQTCQNQIKRTKEAPQTPRPSAALASRAATTGLTAHSAFLEKHPNPRELAGFYNSLSPRSGHLCVLKARWFHQSPQEQGNAFTVSGACVYLPEDAGRFAGKTCRAAGSQVPIALTFLCYRRSPPFCGGSVIFIWVQSQI